MYDHDAASNMYDHDAAKASSRESTDSQKR